LLAKLKGSTMSVTAVRVVTREPLQRLHDEDAAGRVAVLVDLENVVRVRSDLMPAEDALQMLGRALKLAGPADFRIAIAPAGILRRYAGPLVTLALPCESVPAGRDSADLALLAHAEHLASVGYRRFVVVSGDHFFHEICRRHPTTIIARHGQPVARLLRQTALAVLAA